MADTLVFLQLEHGTLTRMLGLLDELHRDLGRGREVDGQLLVLILDYFRDYPDQCHHPKEDVVLRRLRQRDPQAAARIDHVLQDHEHLHEFTRELAEEIERAVSSGRLHAPEVRDRLLQFVQLYREHLEEEDRHFFPVVSSHLRRDDWDLIDFSMFEQDDPLFDPAVESRFRQLRDLIWDGADQMLQEHDDVA